MLLYAFIFSIFTWLCTMFGSSFIFFIKKINNELMDKMLGFAGGVMIASSFFSMLSLSVELSSIYTIIGFALGGLFLYTSDLYLDKKITKSNSFKTILMLIFSITIHNIPEGMAIGVTFASSDLFSAIILAIGIGIQNIPEGMAISFPLLKEGYSKKQAFNIGHASALVEILFSVLGCILVLKIKFLLPFVLSFAAASMIYVVISELIPECKTKKSNLYFILGFILMMSLDILL